MTHPAPTDPAPGDHGPRAGGVGTAQLGHAGTRVPAANDDRPLGQALLLPCQVYTAPAGPRQCPRPPPPAIRVELEAASEVGCGQRIPMFRNDFREIHDLLRYCTNAPPADLDLGCDLTAGMFTARSTAGSVYVALPGGGPNFCLDRYLDSSHMYGETVPPVLYLDCDPPQGEPRGPVHVQDDTPLSCTPVSRVRRRGAGWFLVSIDAWRAIAAGVHMFPRQTGPRGSPATWTVRGTIPEDCIMRREEGGPASRHVAYGIQIPRSIPCIWRLARPGGL